MKSLVSFLLMVLLSFPARTQTKVGDVEVPNTLKSGNTALVLNGAGIREKYWIDLYVGGLYLKAKTNNAGRIIDADENMAIKLHIISDLITSEKMTNAVDEGFKKSTDENTVPLTPKINQFKTVFKEKMKVGDVYDIIYESGTGTLLYKNNKLMCTIPGLDFKKALFGIWLCNDPADENLKSAMLGTAR